MSDPTFMADPTRLVIAAIVGIALLLALIIKFKLHPVLSMMVSALVIGIGAGMPLDMVADTVTKGVGTTLQNIALLYWPGIDVWPDFGGERRRQEDRPDLH